MGFRSEGVGGRLERWESQFLEHTPPFLVVHVCACDCHSHASDQKTFRLIL